MKSKKRNEAIQGVATRRKLATRAADAALTLTSASPFRSADSTFSENCDRTAKLRQDELSGTGYRRLTQSWNLRKARVGITNPRANNFNRPLKSFGAPSRNQRLLPTSGGKGSARDFNPGIHLRQVVETDPCSAVIEERNRMAREIHDTLAQEFAGILLYLEAVNSLGTSDNALEYLARARELARSGLEDARRLLLGLRPKSLEGGDLSGALNQLGEHFSRDCGINCTFSVSGQPNKLPDNIENELYRVAQEALCNVRKHSRAGSASILLSYTSAGVVLAIKDNGQGFVMKQREPGAHGFGLPAMCERANRLGGIMDINSGQGRGTEIRMSVPLPGKTSKERNDQ